MQGRSHPDELSLAPRYRFRETINPWARILSGNYAVSVTSLVPAPDDTRGGTRRGRVVNAIMTAPSKHTPPAMMNGVIHTSGCALPCAAS